MHPVKAGHITRISERCSVKEEHDYIEIAVGIDTTKLNDLEAIVLRNILTRWKNDKTKRDNRLRFKENELSR